jgi:Uma2 family endonuclease
VFDAAAPVGITVAPDWVCEVLSPSTEAIDRAEKMPIYAREEIAHAWLVDPELRTLEVFRWERGWWVVAATYRDEAVVRAEPFGAIELELSALWRP